MSVLDKVRRWIDGESAETLLEEAARDAQIKPRSAAEGFIIEIARKVEDVMQREMVPLPQGTTLIPTEYIVFLSEEDDKDWQGVKRRGLEQGLYHILAEQAREIIGKKKLNIQSFAIEFRVDGTMEKGEVFVQHGWEEGNTPGSNTTVLPRQNPGLNKPRPTVGQGIPVPPAPNFTEGQPHLANQPQISRSTETNAAEEMTRVASRNTALYHLEIWKNNVRQNTMPIYKNEIVIGRGSKSKPVDITLAGDPEISRRHIVLIRDNLGNFSFTNEGRNPAVLDNTDIPIGRRISLEPGQTVIVCSYAVRIRPGLELGGFVPSGFP